MALRVGSLAELAAARKRLEAHGIEVIGVTDHHFIKSIYFFDPNGFRLELTAFVGEGGYMAEKERSAREECAAWTGEKAARRRQTVS